VKANKCSYAQEFSKYLHRTTAGNFGEVPIFLSSYSDNNICQPEVRQLPLAAFWQHFQQQCVQDDKGNLLPQIGLKFLQKSATAFQSASHDTHILTTERNTDHMILCCLNVESINAAMFSPVAASARFGKANGVQST
jgi:hypothetical protein